MCVCGELNVSDNSMPFEPTHLAVCTHPFSIVILVFGGIGLPSLTVRTLEMQALIVESVPMRLYFADNEIDVVVLPRDVHGCRPVTDPRS
jgi:hypothetical protein